MTEVWKEIKAYRDTYEVSNYGRVRKKPRIGARGYHVHGNIKKQRENSNGYLRVSMRIGDKEKEYFVHRLVAELFIPPIPGKTFVNHKDGNKHNNHVSNLEWCTKSENQKHALKTGLYKPNAPRGEKHWGTILTWDMVREIRRIYKKGDKFFGQCALARKYNTSQANIYSIVNNTTWIESLPFAAEFITSKKEIER